MKAAQDIHLLVLHDTLVVVLKTVRHSSLKHYQTWNGKEASDHPDVTFFISEHSTVIIIVFLISQFVEINPV